MDSGTIIDQVRSGHPPSEWNVWPLRSAYVRVAAFKWALLGVIGFALLIPVAIAIIPSDFVGTSDLERSLAIILLALLGTMAFGGVGIAAHELWRLTHARDFWLVITPETFVKSEPGRIVETPLEHVTDLTLKGVTMPTEGNLQTGAAMSQYLLGGRLIAFANRAGIPGMVRSRARGAASLAYRDSRDNKVIVVCTDDSFDQMAAVYQLLRDRAAAREDKLWRASLKSPFAR